MDRVAFRKCLVVVLVTLLTFATLAPVAAWAQAPTWHSDQLIEDNAGAGLDGAYPQVAMSGAGAVAVWYQWDGNNYRIYSNYSTDCGATWHAAQLIDDGGGSAFGPQVAMYGATAVAVWEQYDGSNYRIYSNYSTDGGATWHTAQLIETNAGRDGASAQVAISGVRAVAVWYQWDGGDFRIYSNYSTDGGATWDPTKAQMIETNAGRDGFNPQVTMSGASAVAVWYQWDGSKNRIYSNYSTDGGATWDPTKAQLIEGNAGRNGYGPQVAISDSRAVAVWYQHDGTRFRIYSNYSTDGGVTWDPTKAQLIEDNAGFNGDSPQVAMVDSKAVAVWYQWDGSASRIYSNYSTDSGATWHSDQLIEDNAGLNALLPQVAMSGAGAVAVWQQLDGSGWIRIHSNYSTDGGSSWGADRLIEDNAGYDGYDAQVAMFGCCAVAVWIQWDGTNSRIYSNYGTFPCRAVAPVPTLSLWSTAGLAVVLAALLAWSVRRRLLARNGVG